MFLPFAAHLLLAILQPGTACYASPPTVMPGDTSSIVCACPSNPSWAATAGSISGSGSMVTLNTMGAAPGAVITVTSSCSGTPNTVLVGIAAPPMAPPPQMARSLCTVSFRHLGPVRSNQPTPVTVQNEAKACLDDIALNLETHPDARLAIIGSATAKEPSASLKATERAQNTKTYLVREKGIDPERILLYAAPPDQSQARTLLISPGTDLLAVTKDLQPVEDGKDASPNAVKHAKKKK